MVKWQVILSRQAIKDSRKIKLSGLSIKTQELLEILEQNPFQNPPHYEKLTGDLGGFYSHRINIQHRLVYSVNKEKQIVHVLSLWSHYE